MRALGLAIALAVLGGGSGAALAQKATAKKTTAPTPGAKKRLKEKFYNFDDMLIDGEYKKPNAILFTARDKVKFKRLLNLRRSFIPIILTSDRERALK